MRNSLTVPVLRVLSQESRRHPVDKNASPVRAYDEVLDKIVGSDDLDDVSEAESLFRRMMFISNQDIGLHLVVFEYPH